MCKFFVEVILNCPRAEELKKELCLQNGCELETKIGKDRKIFKVLVAKEQLKDFKDKFERSIIGEDIYSPGNILIEKTTKKKWFFKKFDFKLTGEGVKLVCVLENDNGEISEKFKEELVLKSKN